MIGKIVDVESPYNGASAEEIKRNINYARACMRDSLMRGEIPFASHLLYTQSGILDDKNKEERRLGIDAGKALMEFCDKTVVYVNFGISEGMKHGINLAKLDEREIEYRFLDNWNENPTREGW